jgi:transcriptional regulator with XRE-family HTH domain
MEQKSVQTAYGKRLALARQVRGVTQHQLSKLTGVSQPTIGSTEAQGRGSLKTAEFAKALNIDAYWLATGEGEMLISSAWPFQTFTARDISTISKDGRVYLEQMVTNLLIYLHLGEDRDQLVTISPLVRTGQEALRNVHTNISEISGDFDEQFFSTTGDTPATDAGNSAVPQQRRKSKQA